MNSRSLLLAITCCACGPGPAPLDDAGDPGVATPANPSATACDGSGPAVPAGFPSLGPGCRSHFVYRWSDQLFSTTGKTDNSDPRGARRIEDSPFTGTFDLGTQSASKDGTHNIALFLPSLSPGVYRAADGVGVLHALTNRLSTGLANGKTGALVEVVGATDSAVWGRLVARMCANGGSTKDCMVFDEGRFSAARDAERSELEFGYPIGKGSGLELCETRADCPAYGALPPLCTSGLCSGPAPSGP